MTAARDPRSAALDYLQRGLAPIPIACKSKVPPKGLDNWAELRLTAEDIDSYFPENGNRNIALLLGALNGSPAGEVVADLDCVEARRAADRLLPPTGRVAGRRTNPRSHRHYRVEDAPAKAYDKYKDPLRSSNEKNTLIELLSTGKYVVAPPSIHDKTGETYTWHSFDQAAEVPIAALQVAMGELASAALLGRYWPNGSRHDAALALSGGLLRAGWTVEAVETFVRAVCAAAQDPEVNDRLRAVADTAAKLDAGGQILTGWPTLAQLLGDKGRVLVDQVCEWLGITFGLEPVVIDDAPWPDPPGEEVYHGLAGHIVRLIEPASEADPVALLVQVLVTFGNVIGRGAYFTVEADRHHGNEYAVLVGATSKARKGTSWGHVETLFRAADGPWAAERVQSGVSSGEGIVWAVRDPIHKRERSKERGEPVRYEDVEADPGVSDKRLLIYEPEYATVLKQTERQGNTVSTILRQLWDGRDLRTLTKNSPAKATGAHGSLIGHITAEELRRLLTDTERANGFGNRTLWLCVRRSKLLPLGGSVNRATADQVQAKLIEALDFARTAGEVPFDDAVRAMWCEVYGPLSEGRPGLSGAMLGRAEAHVRRLALLYALLDRSPVIQTPHLMAAGALWDYCERSVRYTFGHQLGDPLADELLRLLQSHPKGMTRTDIRDYFKRHQHAGRIDQALGLLLRHRLARVDEEKTGGRKAHRWFATRQEAKA
jgi:hypothetical protein